MRCSVRKGILRIWHSCFSVNFAKFLKVPFSRTPPGDWLVGLKLIQLGQKTPQTSFHYFSKKIKTSSLQGHKRYIKLLEME